MQELCKKFIVALLLTSILNLICGYFLGSYILEFYDKIKP